MLVGCCFCGTLFETLVATRRRASYFILSESELYPDRLSAISVRFQLISLPGRIRNNNFSCVCFLRHISKPWKQQQFLLAVRILDVINLVPTNAVPAKPRLIVGQFARRLIGPTTRRCAKDTYSRLVALISPRPRGFLESTTGCKYFDTAILP